MPNITEIAPLLNLPARSAHGSSAVRATPLVVTMSYNVDHEFDLRCLDQVFHFAIGR